MDVIADGALLPYDDESASYGGNLFRRRLNGTSFLAYTLSHKQVELVFVESLAGFSCVRIVRTCMDMARLTMRLPDFKYCG